MPLFNRRGKAKVAEVAEPQKSKYDKKGDKSKGGKAKGEKNKGAEDHTQSTDSTNSLTTDKNAVLQEAMSDNLDLMYEIIMRLREDEDYAKTIYIDCPRLQHLLDRHPDLRPIFEDPDIVRINFEQIYRKAGGVLPEDKKSIFMQVLAVIVNHPLFKVFRFLLLIKKFYNCIANGGFALIRGCFMGMFCIDPAPDLDGLEDGFEGNPANRASKEALFKAAEAMEDPDVKDQMDLMLQNNPDQLDEAIENEPDLKALRESNPVCAELMGDPETMKILVDPDNLRALAECPDLIEQDFADPNWMPPDVESVPFDDPAYADASAEGLVDADAPVDEFVDAEAEAEEGGDGEVEEEEEEENGFERGDETKEDAANKGKQQNKNNKNEKKEGNEGGGFLSTIGTGLVDYIAAGTVGMTATEMFGGGDDFGVESAVEEQADEIADEADDAAAGAVGNVERITASASAVGEMADANEDLVDNIEGTMDEAEGAHDDFKDTNEDQAEEVVTNVAASGAIAAGGVMVKPPDSDESKEKEEAKQEPEKKRGFRLGGIGSAIGGGLAALGTATKEFAVGAVLGEHLAKELVEKMEKDSSEEDASDTEKENEKANTKEATKSRGGLFQRRNSTAS